MLIISKQLNKMRRRELLGSAAGVLELSETSFTPTAAAQTLTATATYNGNAITDLSSSMIIYDGNLISSVSVSEGDNTISISISANSSDSNTRTGTVQLNYKGQTKTITITQAKDAIKRTSSSSDITVDVISISAPYVTSAKKDSVTIHSDVEYRDRTDKVYTYTWYSGKKTYSTRTGSWSSTKSLNPGISYLKSKVTSWTTGSVNGSGCGSGWCNHYNVDSYDKTNYTAHTACYFNQYGPYADIDISWYFMD